MPQTGLMMNRPLLISGILEHGAAQFGEQEIVSRETHGPLHRTTYAQAAKRARQLANALAQLGLKRLTPYRQIVKQKSLQILLPKLLKRVVLLKKAMQTLL